MKRIDLTPFTGHTPGPLKADGHDLWHVGKDYNDHNDPHRYLAAMACDCDECGINAKLFAAAPTLKDEVAKLYDEVDRLEIALGDFEAMKAARDSIEDEANRLSDLLGRARGELTETKADRDALATALETIKLRALVDDGVGLGTMGRDVLKTARAALARVTPPVDIAPKA